MTYSKFPLLKKIKDENLTLEKQKKEFDKEKIFKSYSSGFGLKSIIGSSYKSTDKNDFQKLVKRMRFARKSGYPIFFSIGSEVIDKGLSPLIIDLMHRGWISAISVDEDFLIKDFELSLSGNFIDYRNTEKGRFAGCGIAEETGLFLNIAFKEGNRKGTGAGEAVGEYLEGAKFKFNKYSIIANGYRLNIPVILHSTIGTNKLHYHKNFDGGIFGNLLDRDFIMYSSIMSKLINNGIYISINMDKNGLNILTNSIGFCMESGFRIKKFSICTLGEIEDCSVKRGMEDMNSSNEISVLCTGGDSDLILPILTLALLEQA